MFQYWGFKCDVGDELWEIIRIYRYCDLEPNEQGVFKKLDGRFKTCRRLCHFIIDFHCSLAEHVSHDALVLHLLLCFGSFYYNDTMGFTTVLQLS